MIQSDYLSEVLGFCEHTKFNRKCDIYCKNHSIDLTPYTIYKKGTGNPKKVYNLPLDLALGIVENIRMSNPNRGKVLQELYTLKGATVVTQCYIRPEVHLMQGLQQFLEALNFKFIPGHYVLGKYILDGYIPEFNIAVEVDEPFHQYKKEEDAHRMKEVTEQLGCRFVRVPDDTPLPLLLASVVKEMVTK